MCIRDRYIATKLEPDITPFANIGALSPTTVPGCTFGNTTFEPASVIISTLCSALPLYITAPLSLVAKPGKVKPSAKTVSLAPVPPLVAAASVITLPTS